MNIKNTECPNSEDKMCKSCMLFYGSEAYQGLCSACHKKNKNIKKEEIQTKEQKILVNDFQSSRKETADQIKQEEHESIQKPQVDRKRCYGCRKKVGLLGVECKCGYVFCNKHRLPQDHQCQFNHQQAGKKKLEKQIVKVYNGKIADI